jgi:DNA adenine methylase
MDHYPGAKAGAGVWQRIISAMPLHYRYVEAFLGSGEIMARKRPAGINIGIDLDPLAISDARTRLGRLPGLALPDLMLLTTDAVRELACQGRHWRRETLVYCDPPYLGSTRTRRLYGYELWSDDEHRRLLDVLQGLECNVMLSGYPSPIYESVLERGPGAWRKVFYTAATHGGPRTECLWLNFPEPSVLHDPRWVGGDYRRREVLARRARRWMKRLRAMPAYERQYLVDAIASALHPAVDPDTPFSAGRSCSPSAAVTAAVGVQA